MNRRSRFLLAAGVALATAATLHVTVGERFHRESFGYYRDFGCGHEWKGRWQSYPQKPIEHLPGRN